MVKNVELREIQKRNYESPIISSPKDNCQYVFIQIFLYEFANMYHRWYTLHSYSTYFFKINFYWSVVDLLCVSFCCTAKWISLFIYISPLFFRFFFHMGHSSVLSSFPCAIVDSVVCVVCSCSCVQLFTTPWTVAHQVPLSMEFSRQEY